MRNIWRLTLVSALFLTISGCAHKDLIAPCEAGPGGLFGWAWPSSSAWACEAMRPINEGAHLGGR
jgi:hypothetical protein